MFTILTYSKKKKQTEGGAQDKFKNSSFNFTTLMVFYITINNFHYYKFYLNYFLMAHYNPSLFPFFSLCGTGGSSIAFTVPSHCKGTQCYQVFYLSYLFLA